MCLTWSPRQRRLRREGRQGLIQRLNERGGKRRSNPQRWAHTLSNGEGRKARRYQEKKKKDGGGGGGGGDGWVVNGSQRVREGKPWGGRWGETGGEPFLSCLLILSASSPPPAHVALFDPTVTSSLKSTLWSKVPTCGEKYCGEPFLNLNDPISHTYTSGFTSVFISHTAGSLWPLPAYLHSKPSFWTREISETQKTQGWLVTYWRKPKCIRWKATNCLANAHKWHHLCLMFKIISHMLN